jgi:feruloyl esterase
MGSAEKYPADFDGIVAGAPALDFTSLAAWRASFFPLTGALDSADFIQPSVWSELIHDEVLRQCDALDGAIDGIIENPDLCSFDPSPLLCKPGQRRGCLSDKQIGIVRKIFRPLKYDDGTIVYPGMSPGSEERAIDRFYSGKPFSDSQDWFRYVVHSDMSWNPSKFNVERDARASENLNPFNIKTFPSNLDRFRSADGKIIMYHGMQDQQITPFISSRWYDHFMRETKSSPEDIDRFLRYFRISGLFHCAGGPGAWMIGQHDDSVPYDGTRNVLAAIVNWVEQGIAPETIEGTSIGGIEGPGTSFTRKHCRYGS